MPFKKGNRIRLGMKNSDYQKQRAKEVHLGKKNSKEEIEKIKQGIKRRFPDGRDSWNKNLTKEVDNRLDYIRPTSWKKGHIPSNKGKRTGKNINCKTCNNLFYVIFSNKNRKYCSQECINRHLQRSEESKKRYSLSKIGDLNPSKRPEVREKQRLIKQNKIIELGGPRLGNEEKKILDFIEPSIGFPIIRQYPIKGYWLDGYVPERNIVFEIDEKPKISKRDVERENIITNELNCTFIRIPLW